MKSIPRICTITGVEPNQPFHLSPGEHNPYHIDVEGHIIGANDEKADCQALESFIDSLNRFAYIQICYTCTHDEFDILKAAQLIGFRFVGRDETGKVFFSVVNPAFCTREQVLGLYRMYPAGDVCALFEGIHKNMTMRIADAIADYLRK